MSGSPMRIRVRLDRQARLELAAARAERLAQRSQARVQETGRAERAVRQRVPDTAAARSQQAGRALERLWAAFATMGALVAEAPPQARVRQEVASLRGSFEAAVGDVAADRLARAGGRLDELEAALAQVEQRHDAELDRLAQRERIVAGVLDALPEAGQGFVVQPGSRKVAVDGTVTFAAVGPGGGVMRASVTGDGADGDQVVFDPRDARLADAAAEGADPCEVEEAWGAAVSGASAAHGVIAGPLLRSDRAPRRKQPPGVRRMRRGPSASRRAGT
jgi:hypothetical protein